MDPAVSQATGDDAPRCAPTDRFGAFLTSRGHGTEGRVGAVFLSFVMLGLAILIVYATVTSSKANSLMYVAGPVMSVLFAVASVSVLIGGFRSWDFYERGLVREGPRHRMEIPFLDVRWMEYQSVRHYHNGAYTGTQLTLKLGLANGSKLTINFKHKERGKGFLARRIEGTDEMEQVRDAIAVCIAEDLELLFEAGKPVEWGRFATLTRDGVAVLRGKRRGTTVRWSDLREFWEKNNKLWIAARGEPKSFVGIPITGRNFYPCLLLFERVSTERVGQPIRRPESATA